MKKYLKVKKKCLSVESLFKLLQFASLIAISFAYNNLNKQTNKK